MSLLLPPHHPAPQQPAPNLHLLQQPHTSPTVGNTISSHHASHKYQQQSPSSNGGYQHQSQLTYSCCFGLPYQDHNYGAPPPPSPPPVASPPSAYHHNSHHVSSSAASSRLVNGGATSGQQQHVDIENVSCTTEVLTSGAGGGGLHALSAAASAQQRVQITPPPPPPSSSSSSAVDDSITRCICQFDHDDGYMICCDKCGVWQHVDCMGVDRDNIPDKYWCELCEPRPVDAPRAHQLQNNKRQNLILIDTSATETEDETKQSPKRPGFSGGATRGRKKKLLGGGSTHHGLNKLSTGDIKQKGRRKARRGKCKDKPGGQVHSVKSIPVFKQRRNAGTGPNHRKLHMQKGTLMANTPKSPKANKVTSPKAGMSPNKALSPSALPAVTNSPPKSSPVFQPPRPWYNNGEDAYDDAAHNQYSIDIDALLIMRKNGEHGAETDNKPCCQLLDRLLNVARVNGKHKGLEAATDIGSSQAMMEYRGKVILRAQYQKQNPALYTKQSLPHVLFYSQLEGADLVIDATTYGNEGRFVRRSCCPNSEVRHLLDTGGALRFFLFSVKAIPNGSEVTIPFDFNYHECEYPVECACGKPTCPVLKLHTKPEPTTTSPPPPPALPPPKSPAKSPGPVSNLRRKKKRGNTPRVSIDEVPQPLSKRRRLSPLRMSAPPEATPTPLNHKEGRRSSHASEPETRTSKTAISAPVTPTPPNNSSPDKDNEDTKAEKERRKKMTREERKLEAIMKQFAQMEKREERRRDAMARLGKSEEDGGDGGIKSPHGTHMEASAGEDITEQSPEPLIEPEPEPEEVATPVTTRTRGRRRRGGVSAMYVPGRRRSRVSSGVSSATESTHSADEGSSHAPPSSACPLSPSPPASSASSTLPPHSPNVFSYPNKKKACMTEWLNEKATASKHQQQQSTSTSTTTTAETTEDDDEDTTNNNNGMQDPSTNNANPPSSSQSTASTGPQPDNEEEPTNFVRYVQSPRADPLQSHFRRRNSTPASATSGPGPYERMMSTPSTWCSTPGLPADNNAPSAAGSAKKRWLRQAMSESSPPPPPTEMPLKKRRMARASLGEAPVEKEEEVAAPKIASDKNGFNKAKDNLFEVFGSSLDSLQKDSIKEEEEDTPGERDVIYPAHPKARAFRDHSKALSPPLPPQPQRLKEEIVSVEMKEVAVKEESVNVIDQEQPSCSSSVLERQSLKTESEVKTEYPSCSRIDGITRTYSDDSVKKEDIKMETGSPDDEGSRTLSSSAVSYSAAVADSGESLLQEPLVTERDNDSCDVDHTQDTVPVQQGVVEASVEEACEDFKSEVTNQAESSVAASSSTSSNIESSSRIQDCPPSSSSQDLNVMGPPSSPPPATSMAPLSKASDEAQEDEQVSCSTETEVQGAPPPVQESEKEEGEITTDDEVQEEVVVEESAAGSGEGAEEKEEQVDSSSAIAAPPASPPPPSSPPAQATSPSSSCSASGFLEQLQARRRRRLSTGAASITGSDVTSTAGPPTSPYWGEHRSLPPASTPATPSSLTQASADFWSMSADTVADSSSSSAAATATAAVGSMGSTMTDNVTSSSSGCMANVDMPEDSSPVTSSSNSLHHNHIKKKVSLLEYRKRKRPLPPRSSISSSNRSSTSSSSSSSSSSAASSTAVRHLSPLPTPPLNCTGSLQLPPALRSDSPVPSTSSPPPPPPPPQEEWKPTMAEQTQLSLTERLRREFGLDATSDEDEDDSKGRNGKDESDEEDDVPPPPPPPPPAPSHPAVQPQPVVMGLKGQSVLPHHLPQVSPRCNGRPPPLLPTPGLLPTPAGGKTHALLPTPAESAAASSSSSSSAAALSMAAAGAATVCLLQQLSSSAAAVPSAAAATAASHRAQAASAGSSTSPGFESVAAYNSAPSSSHHFPATTPSSSATSSSSSSPMVVNYNHGLRG